MDTEGDQLDSITTWGYKSAALHHTKFAEAAGSGNTYHFGMELTRNGHAVLQCKTGHAATPIETQANLGAKSVRLACLHECAGAFEPLCAAYGGYHAGSGSSCQRPHAPAPALGHQPTPQRHAAL